MNVLMRPFDVLMRPFVAGLLAISLQPGSAAQANSPAKETPMTVTVNTITTRDGV
jgi:non-heme chloroperoxidase